MLAAVTGAMDLGHRVVLAKDAVCSSVDETHDAMVDIYCERFELQLEAVDTEAILQGLEKKLTLSPFDRRGTLAMRTVSAFILTATLGISSAARAQDNGPLGPGRTSRAAPVPARPENNQPLGGAIGDNGAVVGPVGSQTYTIDRTVGGAIGYGGAVTGRVGGLRQDNGIPGARPAVRGRYGFAPSD